MKADVSYLSTLDSWEWPPTAGQTLLDALRDRNTKAEDRVVAAELAGDLVVMNDELAQALLAVVQNSGESEALRSAAALALGPVLEQVDTDGFEDSTSAPIAEAVFERIKQVLQQVYADQRNPKDLRRRALEASVRAPQDWHPSVILEAYNSRDDAWRLTAVFCMGFVKGFEAQILEALSSKNEEIAHEAIVAADNFAVDAAWPHVVRLVSSSRTTKRLLLAAIGAVASIRPEEAFEILSDLEESKDDDVADAAREAIAMAEALIEEEDEEGEDEEDEDEEGEDEEGEDEEDEDEEDEDEEDEDEEDEDEEDEDED